MNKLLLAVLTLCLFGCAPPLVVMQSPAGELAQCRSAMAAAFGQADLRDCVDGYAKAGWHSMNAEK